MARHDSAEEDLAIQDTLAMDSSERLKLIAALIVDKIKDSRRIGHNVLKLTLGESDV